jgi:hypothetical protein
MSLSTFLARQDVRQKFRSEFQKPKLIASKALLAPPLSKRYSLVGTAFDYLFRFYLERLNPDATQSRWIAEAGLARLGEQFQGITDIDSGKTSFEDSEELKIGRAALNRARVAHDRYVASGKIRVSLLQAVICLAQLDVVCRSGFVDENLGDARPEDIRDLRKLISLVRPLQFRAKKRCLLNPSFGVASHLVGGADADVLIDGTLIEIKTIKNFELDRDHFNQLLGYVVLDELNRLNGARPGPRISRIAIYFARHAHLEIFDLRKLLNTETFPTFLQWFSDTAKLRVRRKAGSSNRSRAMTLVTRRNER